jgi:hypothetical protein
MFVCVLFLALFQKEDYQQKGYKLMIQASSYIDDDSQYYRNPQRILSLRERSFELAMKMRFDEKEIKKLAQSEEIIDRVAASYAIGLSTMSTIDDKLFDLLLDDNNIVSIAARESFVYIANNRLNNFLVDQGPPPSANKHKKYEASVLWRIFLSHHQLTHNNYSKEELSALDDLMVILRREWKNKIFREDNKTQLEPEIGKNNKDPEPRKNNKQPEPKKNKKEPEPQENEEDQYPLPSDLLDPSIYTVKSLFPRKSQLLRKP